MKKKIISDEKFYNLSCNILHLVDRNRIVWEGVRYGNPDRIYPFTMLSLHNFYAESNRGPQYAGRCSQKIAEALQLARDPRVLAAEISAEGWLAAAVPVATVPSCCSIMWLATEHRSTHVVSLHEFFFFLHLIIIPISTYVNYVT